MERVTTLMGSLSRVGRRAPSTHSLRAGGLPRYTSARHARLFSSSSDAVPVYAGRYPPILYTLKPSPFFYQPSSASISPPLYSSQAVPPSSPTRPPSPPSSIAQSRSRRARYVAAVAIALAVGVAVRGPDEVKVSPPLLGILTAVPPLRSYDLLTSSSLARSSGCRRTS
jgi:hypothetical protein